MASAEPDLAYLMRRAREEARSAAHADKPEAAAVHRDLSVRYSARALMTIAEDDAPGH